MSRRCRASGPSPTAVTFPEDEGGFRGEELRALPQFHYVAGRKAGAEERGVIWP